MPQLSFIPELELHEVRVTLRMNRLNGGIDALLVATNRGGDVLASAGLRINGLKEADLLPLLLAEVGYGYLYQDAKGAVTEPVAEFRKRRKSLV